MGKHLLFGVFSDNLSAPASMLSWYAINKSGWSAEIERFTQADSDADICRKIEAHQPDLIALTFKTFERATAFQVARVAKTLGIKVICGGVHPSAAPNDISESGLFDGFVVGDGMGIFGEILDSPNSLDGQQILGRKHPDTVLYTNRYLSQWQKDFVNERQIYEMLTNAGCFYECTFCSTDRAFRKYPIEACAQHIVDARKEMDFTTIYIWDDIFPINAGRISRFRKILESEGLSFNYFVNARAGLFDRHVAEELKLLGARDITFGLETASPKMGDFLKKEGNAQQVAEARKICAEFELPFKCNVILGIPTEEPEDLQMTVDWVVENNPDMVAIYHFTPFPGSGLYQYCIDNDHMPDDWSFDSYLGLEENLSSFKGYRKSFGMLKGINYDLVGEYRGKIEEHMNNRQDQVLLKFAAQADDRPWAIFGAGGFFYRILERATIHQHKWKNFLGFYEHFDDEYHDRTYEIDLKRFEWRADAGLQPETLLLTKHWGHAMISRDIPILVQDFAYTGKIESISTFPEEPGYRAQMNSTLQSKNARSHLTAVN
jgi:anaerobic magnesium-protoporphyrin IX monomethyl ester cyclase